MDLEEIGINVGNWVDSAQDGNYWRAFVNAALNLLVSYAMESVVYFYFRNRISLCLFKISHVRPQ